MNQAGYTLVEALLEKLHTVALQEAKVAEEQAQESTAADCQTASG